MKMRTKAIILFTAALLLTTVIVLPRIIEAKRLRALNADTESVSLTAAHAERSAGSERRHHSGRLIS